MSNITFNKWRSGLISNHFEVRNENLSQTVGIIKTIMNRLFIYFVLFNSLLITSSYGQQFSHESFDLFWKSMHKFETQDVISIEQLDELWNSPGYSSWTGSKRSQNIYFNYFSLVNSPHLKDSLRNELERSKGYRLTLFNHFLEAKQKQLELTDFVKRFIVSDVIEKAKKQAFKYLPDTLSVDNDNTIISLMIFQPDAFAVPEDNVVLMDVLFAYNYGEGIEKFLGHELHHIYLSKYISRLKLVDYENDALIWSIDKLRNEGIADLIDKENILEKNNKTEYDLKYIDHYHNSKQHLEAIDSLLQEIAKDNSILKENGKKIRGELPFSAHPTGLYLAKIIKEKMGTEALLQCLESPFPFLYLYNDIAMESHGEYYVISIQSIDYLKKIEKEFIDIKQFTTKNKRH